MQSEKLLLSESKEITFNQWAETVKFGSKCDRLKYESFINSYEDAKFIKETSSIKEDDNQTTASRNTGFSDSCLRNFIRNF